MKITVSRTKQCITKWVLEFHFNEHIILWIIKKKKRLNNEIWYSTNIDECSVWEKLSYIYVVLKMLHIRDSTFLFFCSSGIRAPHALFQIYFIGPAWKLLIQLLLYPMHWFPWNFVGMKDTMCRCAYYQEIPIPLFFWEFSPLNLDLRIFFLIWM